MKTIIQLILLLSAVSICAQGNKISITIDDLPCPNCATIQVTETVTQNILQILKKYHVPAIGFVNEGKLYSDNTLDQRKVNLIIQWLENNQEIGNHTFSHVNIEKTSVADYAQDILKGETITRPLLKQYNKQLKYFRHPQLRTGPDSLYKAQLDSVLSKLHYTVAPVTMDNDEYIYAYCYKKAKAQNDSAGMRAIADDYISYMIRIFDYYEMVSNDFLGYNVNQILLLHANELNADYLDQLLDILIRKNYTFVSLDEALTDKAYQLPEAISNRGISWFDRWRLAQGLPRTHQPEASDKIMNMFKQFSK
jgi:peptidoglycan-N-acetylglucosamine deacetylase